MGEYARTRQKIAELKEEQKAIIQEMQNLAERLQEIKIEIGECEGYLLELDGMDNTDPEHKGECL